MKTNNNYKYHEIAGEYYLIPVGVAAEKSIVPIQLTETAAWIWRAINEAAHPTSKILAEKMTTEYDISAAQAYTAINQFLTQLHEQGLLE